MINNILQKTSIDYRRAYKNSALIVKNQQSQEYSIFSTLPPLGGVFNCYNPNTNRNINRHAICQA